MKRTIITGHSGCEGTERDSLLSIDCAIELHAEAVEVDVRMAQDGALRISHDAVSAEAYRAKPLLETVFEKISATDLLVNCDIKEPSVVWPVIRLAERFGLKKERLLMSGSISPERLFFEPEINDRVTVWMNGEEILKFLCSGEFARKGRYDLFPLLMLDPWEVLSKDMADGFGPETLFKIIRTCGAYGLNYPVNGIDREIAEAFRKGGVPISLWTVNTPDQAAAAFSAEPDNITTLEVAFIQRERSRICGS